ncbi:MAG: alpha/beta fold hydrolase, partial [Candidatus Kariarchaeaceae archaeon]
MKSVVVDTDSGQFHYEVSEIDASKPTVLFLHGGSPKSQHTKFWEPIMEQISPHCNPVLIDRFGHGMSTGRGGLAANDNAISMVIDTLLQEDVGKVFLVGRSAGAVFCIRQWMRRPDDIAGIGFIAPGSMASYADKLGGFSGKMTVLWDIDDPVVSFANYSLLEDFDHQLYTIGDHPAAGTTASREI